MPCVATSRHGANRTTDQKVRPGLTDSSPTTFAGILAFLEHNYGLPALNATDASAYDYSGEAHWAIPLLNALTSVYPPAPGTGG